MMGLRNVLQSQSKGDFEGFEALQIPADGVSELTAAIDEYPREAVVARPHQDNDGIPAMQEVLESLHTTETKSGHFSRKTKNVAGAHAFEMRYARERPESTDRVVTLQYLAGSDVRDTMLEQQLTHRYPNTIFDRREPSFLDVSKGQYVAGATLGLRRYTLYPIRSVNLDGFRSDPTGSIIKEMTGMGSSEATADADVIVQILFKPALRDWLQGVKNGEGIVPDAGKQSADSTAIEGTPSVSDLIFDLKQPTQEKRRHQIFPWKKEWIEHDPSPRDREVAKMLDEQDGKAWRLYFRIFAVSDDPDVAIDRASKTASMFRNYYEYRGEQTFLPQPFSRKQLPEQLYAGARREWEDVGIVKTQGEVAGTVNIPTADDVSSGKMRWTLAKPGDGVPPGTPRFNFKEHGVAGASRAEKQVAMFDANEDGDPIWVGWGAKHSTEVGIPDWLLKIPSFILGRSGVGKTTCKTNIFSQAAQRDHGALVIDPNGQAADDFIAEWPEDRPEEDLVVMDLEREDLLPQFNFLEIPGVPDEIDLDSYTATTMIEAIADDLEAMVAQAGGDDNYIGSVMKRVTKTVARGMLKSERRPTLLDLACCVSSQENLEIFSNWMSEERMHFIRETARRQAETKTDSDLDPLAGRMDEWIHNDAIRDLISARDPSFSVHDIVKEGKTLVVKFPEAAGESLKQLLSTALIRRTYCSKRLIDNDEPFWLFCDEFDSVATEQSNIHGILSEARKYNYRCVLACQSPANQLPGEVKEAVEDQCENLIAFKPGSEKNCRYASYQHTVDKETFSNMSYYQFYFRTHDDTNSTTPSYLVESFRPVREVRAEIDDLEPRTEREIEEMKQRSLERYGAPIKSPEQQRADSYFTGDETPSVDGADDGDRGEIVETLCCKAAYDEAIHETKEQYLNAKIDMAKEPDLFDTWVDVGKEATEEGAIGVYGRFLRYFRDVDPHAAENLHMGVFSSVVESLSELEVRVLADGTEQICCTKDAPTRFKGSGDDRTRGSIAHGQMLIEWYERLTRLGLEITIVEQTGDRDADAIGRIRESLPELEQLHRGEITHRQFAPALEQFQREHPLLYELTGGEDVTIEAEKSTTRSPGKTARNLAKAYERGEKCMFLTTTDRAHRVYNGLTDPPFVRDDDGDRARLYHIRTLSIGEETPLRPNTTEENYWYFEYETSDFVLTDGDGEELSRFDSLDAVKSSLNAYPADTSSVDEELIGPDGDWRQIKLPFDPRDAFGDEWPTEEDYEILAHDGDSMLCLLASVLGPLNRLIDRGAYDPSIEEEQHKEPVSDEDGNEELTSDTEASSDSATGSADDLTQGFEKLYQND